MYYVVACCASADNKYSWPDLSEQPTDDTTLRREQIKCRIAEIEAVVDVMRKLSRGEKLVDGMTIPNLDWERFRCVDVSTPVMAGHSLGGSAAVSVSLSWYHE